MTRLGDWNHLERQGAECVIVDGFEVRVGGRVRLHPRAGADVFDLVLEGRTAIVEAIEEDVDGEAKLVVVVEDDPGRELGYARQLGHRFFFSAAEVDPVESAGADSIGSSAGAELPEATARILLAGIGNVFLADDGFGVALAERLSRRELPSGVEVVDYGIRGMDLAFAMQDEWDAVVLLDATPRGEAPGTLYVIEVDPADEATEVAVDAHGMDPVSVIGLVRSFGGTPPRTLVVGCEPLTRMGPEDEEIVAQLSDPVREALDPAVQLVESLLSDLISSPQTQEVTPP